ncbi:MAG: hypothetical protein UV73_C0003G0187 [Candidatus Gottesmanbacteria bacterium GW2011_GWA2_43_14]|uniref:YjbQ family protein n=1 Tax=Candidatus Gottesmanbacteria bacterium GW2011_GWA2_43_14 TaxID=1618443 RepID=A0A0G1DK73_9BACT|nr:MAG: hypothetical protein UV73_C0003G0187 [Candidatus Gottesmanbacteria bacterium GW2011_GWA2_43_14]
MKNQFTVETRNPKQIVDITDRVNDKLQELKAGDGLVHLQVLHTTCALTTADLDPGTDRDYLEAIEKMFPEGNWIHPHNPAHVGDHIMSSLIGPSVVLTVGNGELVLGTWQRVVLVELSGPRPRKITLTFIRTS